MKSIQGATLFRFWKKKSKEKKQVEVEGGSNNNQPAQAAMERALKEAEKTDPLVRAKMGATAVKENLYEAMKQQDNQRVHVDTALAILGSVAGFSCLVMATIAHQAGHGKDDPESMVGISGADGHNYFFSKLANALLLENQHSVWALVAGMAGHLGSTSSPDVVEIVQHVAETVGGETFGIPRTPEGHGVSDTPRTYVKDFWAPMIKIAQAHTQQPADWPILFGLAIQQVMQDGREALDPGLAAQIVMECAVPMSRIDPEKAV